MSKEPDRIRVLLIEDRIKSRQSLYSLFTRKTPRNLRIATTASLSAIRKKIAWYEVDVILLTLAPDDTRIGPLHDALKTSPALPIITVTGSKRHPRGYPFTVRERLTRAEVDVFLLTQMIVSVAESGRLAGEFGQRISEYHSNEARFMNVILSNADGLVVVNHRDRILFVNPAARVMLGDMLDIHKNRFPYAAPENEFVEVKTTSSDGQGKTLEMRSVSTTWEGEAARLISLRDITSRKTAERTLRESEERYALAVSGSKDGLWDWDLAAGKIYFSAQWKSMLGFADKEIGDDPEEWFSRIHESDVRRVKNAINAHLIGNTAYLKTEHRVMHKNGSCRWVLVRGTAVRNKKGTAIRIAGSMTDTTERKKAERQLKKALADLRFALASEKILMEELDHKNKELVELSITDGLTGLYNHRFLQERFDFEYKRLRRYGGSLSIMIIDIDLFKAVNDTYGHQFGDFVLKELGDLLRSNSREVDICGRYGGEEFMIITNLPAAEIMKYANKLHSAVEKHVFSYDAHSVHVTVSVGIAEYHTDLKSKQELIERADTALYQAKKDGRNLIRLWKDVGQQDEKTIDRFGIEEFKKKFVNISDQMRSAYMQATDALIKAVDAKDPFAHEHSHNVSKYAVEIARQMNLSAVEVEVIKYAGLLHDIGKIGIKQDILTKKEKLTQKEYEVLKKHPIVGCNILKDVKFLEKELPIILHHHERYDGAGYPYGLKEREIPLGARILAVADSYDAMTAGRTYKKRLDHEAALEELRRQSGSQFAPDIVEVFLKLAEMKKVHGFNRERHHED
jgi:diguanylate cyclase (GGDEF)-like protein/PAS domain S-box-containing protein/putative nucleotidyltransferase with HDIG domain